MKLSRILDCRFQKIKIKIKQMKSHSNVQLHKLYKIKLFLIINFIHIKKVNIKNLHLIMTRNYNSIILTFKIMKIKKNIMHIWKIINLKKIRGENKLKGLNNRLYQIVN